MYYVLITHIYHIKILTFELWFAADGECRTIAREHGSFLFILDELFVINLLYCLEKRHILLFRHFYNLPSYVYLQFRYRLVFHTVNKLFLNLNSENIWLVLEINSWNICLLKWIETVEEHAENQLRSVWRVLLSFTVLNFGEN